MKQPVQKFTREVKLLLCLKARLLKEDVRGVDLLILVVGRIWLWTIAF